jgi:hypothetical protein
MSFARGVEGVFGRVRSWLRLVGEEGTEEIGRGFDVERALDSFESGARYFLVGLSRVDVDEVDELLDVRDVTDSAREIGRIGVGGAMRDGRDCIIDCPRNVLMANQLEVWQ